MKLDEATFSNKAWVLGVGSAMMIASGYYGELVISGDLTPRWVCWLASMAFFLYIVHELREHDCHQLMHLSCNVFVLHVRSSTSLQKRAHLQLRLNLALELEKRSDVLRLLLREGGTCDVVLTFVPGLLVVSLGT